MPSFPTAYATPLSSRVLTLKLPSTLATVTTPYGRIVWEMDGTGTVSAAKIAFYSMDDQTNVVGDIEYNFGDRNIYNELESGAFKQYTRNFRRSTRQLWKYNEETINLFFKSGSYTDLRQIDPFMCCVDFDSEWSSIGEHIHSFPAR